MRRDLCVHAESETTPGSFALQKPRVVKVDLSRTGGHCFAKQGSMVAYQENVDVADEERGRGSGVGVGRFFRKAFTGEGTPLMRVSGSGDVFLADQADEIGVVHLKNTAVTVNGRRALALESALPTTSRGSRVCRCSRASSSTPPRPVAEHRP